MEPLSPQRKWRAITLATLVLVPAFWSMLAGLVAAAQRRGSGRSRSRSGDRARPRAHPVRVHRPGLHVGAPARTGRGREGDGRSRSSSGSPSSALAGDAVTGIVAGVGAGGIVALRADDDGALAVPRRRHSPPPRSTRSCSYGRRARSRCSRRRSSRSRASASPTTSPSAGASGKPRALERRLPRDVRLGCRDVGVPDRRRRRSRRARRLDLGHVRRDAGQGARR